MNILSKTLILLLSAITISCSQVKTTSKPIPSPPGLSYTDEFVDNLNKSLERLPQPAVPKTYGSCDCPSINQDAKIKNFRGSVTGASSDSYDKLMQSQFLKNAIALAAYKIYTSTNDPGVKNYMKYIVGITGYWELAAARAEKKLLRPICGTGSTVDLWRKGVPLDGQYKYGKEIPDFAAIVSTIGDLALGIITANRANKSFGGTRSAYKWGQGQEGYAEYEVANNCSGVFLTSNINPDAPMSYVDKKSNTNFKLHLVPQFVWVDFTLDFVNYNLKRDGKKIKKVIARGERYLRQFKSMKPRVEQVMNLAYSRIQNPKKSSTIMRNFVNKDHAVVGDLLESIIKVKLEHSYRNMSSKNSVVNYRDHQDSQINQMALASHKKVIADLKSMKIKDSTNQSICALVNILKPHNMQCHVPSYTRGHTRGDTGGEYNR